MRRINVPKMLWYGFGLVLMCMLAAMCSTGCANTRALVSDIGDGAAEYRAVQTEQRAGEIELAVTGARIETGLTELERSVSASKGTEQDIGSIIQRVREREIDPAFIKEWRNRKTETGSGANGKDCGG
jgi:hypothetical protein